MSISPDGSTPKIFPRGAISARLPMAQPGPKPISRTTSVGPISKASIASRFGAALINSMTRPITRPPFPTGRLNWRPMALHIPSNADLTALLYFSALLCTFSSSSWITMRRFLSQIGRSGCAGNVSACFNTSADLAYSPCSWRKSP